MNVTVQPAEADLAALKTKQHAGWSSGNYAIAGGDVEDTLLASQIKRFAQFFADDL
jgi:hypothetical protein